MSDNWREISTAPKDGTWIMVVLAGEYMPGKPFIPTIVMWGMCPLAKREGWLDCNSDVGTETLVDARFTHWQPLPEPPSGAPS